MPRLTEEISMNQDVIVVILDETPKSKSGTFEDDSGKERAWTTRKQEARMEVNGYAFPYDVRLEEGTEPFKLGRYRMAVEKMVSVNKGAHVFSKYPVLVPAPLK